MSHETTSQNMSLARLTGELQLTDTDITISNTTFQAPAKTNTNLGTLSLLPLEIRNNIYSRLLEDDYKQVYGFDDFYASIMFDASKSSEQPTFLKVNQTFRMEILGALNMDRLCEVWIEEHKIITNFAMHTLDAQRTPRALMQFAIPCCKRIFVTIDPPSPTSVTSFYTLRQNIQAFIDIINTGARDINPQICVELDRTGLDRTYDYNEFAMFFGPFVGLSSRCRAAMMFRTTGHWWFKPKVESYCNFIEAAMQFVPEARCELKLRQYLIDIKLPIALMPFEKLNYHNLDNLNRPCVWPGIPQLSDRQLKIVKASVASLINLHEEQKTIAPTWLLKLARHLKESRRPKKISKELRTLVLEGSDVNAVLYWAEGLLSGRNPIFDVEPLLGGVRRETTAT